HLFQEIGGQRVCRRGADLCLQGQRKGSGEETAREAPNRPGDVHCQEALDEVVGLADAPTSGVTCGAPASGPGPGWGTTRTGQRYTRSTRSWVSTWSGGPDCATRPPSSTTRWCA